MGSFPSKETNRRAKVLNLNLIVKIRIQLKKGMYESKSGIVIRTRVAKKQRIRESWVPYEGFRKIEN